MAFSPSWLAAPVLVALGFAQPAYADGSGSISCIGSGGAVSCAGQWTRSPRDPHILRVKRDAEPDPAAIERDRRWVARCKPVVHQDHFGVPRYAYAAPGCEFGKIDD